jgi:hypothetical protein
MKKDDDKGRFQIKTHRQGDHLGWYATRVEADEALAEFRKRFPGAVLGDLGPAVPMTDEEAERQKFMDESHEAKKTALQLQQEEEARKTVQQKTSEVKKA